MMSTSQTLALQACKRGDDHGVSRASYLLALLIKQSVADSRVLDVQFWSSGSHKGCIMPPSAAAGGANTKRKQAAAKKSSEHQMLLSDLTDDVRAVVCPAHAAD